VPILQDKTAVVTGAASGIGRATAINMVREGANVVLADIDDAGLSDVAAVIGDLGGHAVVQHTDVSSEEQIRAMIERTLERFGRIDILHNNAAALGPEALGSDLTLDTMTSEMWDRTFAVNLRSQMLAAKYAVAHMVAAGGGAIINMSSGASLGGDLARVAYSSAKGGVNTLTRSIATMYGKRGVRCNAVAPGFVLSPPARLQVPPDVMAIYEQNCLVPYLGEPEDVAAVVVFLASDQARYVTGQVISVDGGSFSHLGTVPAFRNRQS
jgi:NAD(P)-dependent dehydrogenase (short-subunit alcohol dehydrogenase family)